MKLPMKPMNLLKINSKFILLTSIALFSLYMGSSYIKEGINPNCCGGLLPGVHYLESDTKAPKIIKRCVKPDPNNSGETLWNSFPCTNESGDNCCGGEGECVPTDKGGYCKMDSGGNKIYKDGSLKNTMFLGEAINVDDPDSYEGDVDLDLSGEDLFDRRRAERDQAIRAKEEERYGNLGYTEGEALISDTQEVLFFIYLIHLLFILSLTIALSDSMTIIIQGYVDSVFFKFREFQGY